MDAAGIRPVDHADHLLGGVPHRRVAQVELGVQVNPVLSAGAIFNQEQGSVRVLYPGNHFLPGRRRRHPRREDGSAWRRLWPRSGPLNNFTLFYRTKYTYFKIKNTCLLKLNYFKIKHIK